MARSVALAHLVRQEDGTSEGVWAGHTLRSAFQPIFALAKGHMEIVAHEGLLRAFRDGADVPPMTFFSSIPDLDRLHVETLTRTLHLLNAAACLPEGDSVFVNFNPSVFSDRTISDQALRDMRLVLHEAGIDASRVVCEVTEQRSASRDTLLNFVEALRTSGFRIAVDDYGADDSDIVRVTELSPDIVKFDAQWMARLMDSPVGHKLLATLIQTFQDRGILTVFEGIEEAWQIDAAAQTGVTMLQGYALARPELAIARSADGHSDNGLQPLAAETSEPAPVTARLTGTPDRIFGKRAVAL